MGPLSRDPAHLLTAKVHVAAHLLTARARSLLLWPWQALANMLPDALIPPEYRQAAA